MPVMTNISAMLRERLALANPVPVEFRRSDVRQGDGFVRERIEYHGLEGDVIPAFLFTPSTHDARGGVVVFHQHNGEFHFGKSEVAGDVGDPFQAFGPALARQGLAVLAPDAITFEDRRGAVRGVEPDYYDWLQHYSAMSYRLLDGDVLMRKCLDDAQRALSVLLQATGMDGRRVGVAGHSYGGYTALYHAALDVRCSFACIRGCRVQLRDMNNQREKRGAAISRRASFSRSSTTGDLSTQAVTERSRLLNFAHFYFTTAGSIATAADGATTAAAAAAAASVRRAVRSRCRWLATVPGRHRPSKTGWGEAPSRSPRLRRAPPNPLLLAGPT